MMCTKRGMREGGGGRDLTNRNFGGELWKTCLGALDDTAGLVPCVALVAQQVLCAVQLQLVRGPAWGR